MSGPQLLDFNGWLGAGVGGFSSTRIGGTSIGAFNSLNLGTNTGDDPQAVLANRRLAFEAAGLDPVQGVFLQQVHGFQISQARREDAGRGLARWDDGLPECDAVFTRDRGLALAIGHADCLAIVLADAEAGLLGVAHAGWRGALAGIAGSLAERLIQEGASPGRLKALLSPCLGPAWLELGVDQHKLFAEAYPGLDNFASPLTGGKFHLDLRACATAQLLAAGVQASHLAAQPLCSFAQGDLFFSFRRDLGTTGRMLTVAYLK